MIKTVPPTRKRSNSTKSESKDIFRKRKPKKCYCGWHSQGKESFNPEQTKYWKKNLHMYWRRMLRRFRIKHKG